MTLNSDIRQLCLALWATRQPMHDDMLLAPPPASKVRLCARVAHLAALAGLTQTLASAFLQTIAAGRLAAIVTVFRQLVLQLLDQLLLGSYLFLCSPATC